MSILSTGAYPVAKSTSYNVLDDIHHIFSFVASNAPMYHIELNTTARSVVISNEGFTASMIFSDQDKLIMLSTPTNSIVGNYDTLPQLEEALQSLFNGDLG